jgi:hypothetical protein
MKAVSRSKKLNVINVVNFQNDARSLARQVTSWLSLKNCWHAGLPSVFRIDSVYQMETSLSHALFVY